MLGGGNETDEMDARQRRIPRIIHQVFIGGELTPHLRANVDALKARNPGWEHRLYDDERAERLIRDVYGDEMLALYKRIDPAYPAARADLLRNLIIYDAGGVYLDIKSTFERPLDEVIQIEDSYLLAQWRNGAGEVREGWGLHRDLRHIPGGEFITYFIVAEKKHPYSRAAIQKIVQNVRNYRSWSAVGRTGVLRTTGPIAYTLAIYPLLNLHSHRFTTEEELQAKPFISDYETMESHYSSQTRPVVSLSKIGAALSRFFVTLRTIKHTIIKSSSDAG